MASKMPFALDNKNTRISIEMAESSDFEAPLHCEYCKASVSFVNAYPREVGDTTVLVEAFFRLKGGYVHGDDCQYNLKGRIKIVARQSDSSILALSESGKYELRLLAVKKSINELQQVLKNRQTVDHSDLSGIVNKEYKEAEERLGSYINSALRVLKIRSICLENKEIENLLELNFDGLKLPWKDFYYEDKEYFRCYKNIKGATVPVPVAIKGIVNSIKPVYGKNAKFLVMNLLVPYRKTKTENLVDAVSVSIWSVNLDFFESYKKDDEIVVFGMWSAKEVKENKHKAEGKPETTYRNHELRIWPASVSQIAKIKI